MTRQDTDKPIDPDTTPIDGVTAATKATERAGITSADIDQVESKHPSEFSSLAYDTLSWDELMKSIWDSYPDREDLSEKELAAYRKAMDGAFGGMFIVPKVTDGTIPDNAQLFVELYDTVIQGKPLLPWSKVKSFASATERGLFSISQQGIFFQAGVDDDKKAKPFTQEEARQIALIAMHNKDLLPPNEIKITGSDQERALIKKEVELLNEALPANARFTIANAADIPDVKYDEIKTDEIAPAPVDLGSITAPPLNPLTRSEFNQEFNNLDKLKGERLLRDIEYTLKNMISRDELKIIPIGRDGIFEIEAGQNQPQFEGIRFETHQEDKTDLEIVFMPKYEDRPSWVLNSHHIPNDTAQPERKVIAPTGP